MRPGQPSVGVHASGFPVYQNLPDRLDEQSDEYKDHVAAFFEDVDFSCECAFQRGASLSSEHVLATASVCMCVCVCVCRTLTHTHTLSLCSPADADKHDFQ